MKIISWNIRVLTGRNKQRILKNSVMIEKPDILFLTELRWKTEFTPPIRLPCTSR
jgi:exonuclease III